MSKKALLIGINRYLVPGADLRGCVNDVRNLAAVLTGLYGFRKSDVRVMTDAEATKRAMQAGIRELIRGGRKGDVLVLHYSGHGSNVPDKSGDEADQRDEILCPHDLDWKDPLTDDWLRSTFDGLRPGVNLTVIMDCCHSGTNTRAIQPPDAPVKQRFLPNPLDLLAAESGRRLRGTVTGELRRSTRPARRRGDIVAADLPELLITGCRDTQTSADAFIDGSYTGALTYALVDAMRKANGRLTYRELHGRALATLQRRRFEQVPQLEGSRAAFDRPVFA
jgi:hypothetical protein